MAFHVSQPISYTNSINYLTILASEAYYQLRFGGRGLTATEQDSINQALTQLEQALAQAVKH